MINKMSSIIALVSIILLIFIALYGINVGGFQILSVSQIIEKNNLLNSKIDKATKLSSDDYPQSIKKLEDTFDDYLIQKEKYSELVGFVDEKRMKYMKQNNMI